MAVYAFSGAGKKYTKKRLTEETSKKRSELKKLMNEIHSGKHIKIDWDNNTFTLESDDEDIEKNDDEISTV